MKKFTIPLSILFICCLFVIYGCSPSTPTTTTPAPTTTTAPATTTEPVTTKPSIPATAAPTTAAPGIAKYGGWIKLAIESGVKDDFGWPITCDWMHIYAQKSVNQESLILLTKAHEIKPWLAESWDIAADKMSIVFHLKKGVKFHDGTDFNADAVKFIIDANLEAKTGVSSNWESADIIDDYTLRLNFKVWENSIWNNLTMQSMTFVSPTQVKEKGIEYAKTHPVGTGPFKFSEFKSGQYIRLTKFDDYWGRDALGNKLPYLDGVEIITIADQMTLQAAFASSAVNVLSGQTAKVVNLFKAQGYEIVAYHAGTGNLMPDNDPNSHFADIRVRQALEYAIDKDAVCETLGFGAGLMIPNNQIAPNPHPAWNPNIEWKKYDPAKAKQLLAEAGYPEGFKTVLFGEPRRLDMTVLYQKFLKDVGIIAEIDTMDNLAYYSKIASGWKDSLNVSDWSFSPNFAAKYKYDFPPLGVLNVSVIQPSNITELLDKATTAVTDEEIKQANWALSQALADTQTFIPVYGNALANIYPSYVKDGEWQLDSDWCAWRPDKTWLDLE